MVPLRSATTLLGTPALMSDCAPMMLRVRPAQLTTTSVSGEGARSWTRSTSSAPGTLTRVGIETRWIFVERPAVEHDHVGAAANQPIELVGRDARRAAGVLDEFAEGLARHVDAGEQLEAGRGPGRDAAGEHVRRPCSRRERAPRRALGEAVVIVAQHDAGRAARHQPRHPQLEAAQGQRAREQKMALREGQLLAQVDEREFPRRRAACP